MLSPEKIARIAKRNGFAPDSRIVSEYMREIESWAKDEPEHWAEILDSWLAEYAYQARCEARQYESFVRDTYGAEFI